MYGEVPIAWYGWKEEKRLTKNSPDSTPLAPTWCDLAGSEEDEDGSSHTIVSAAARSTFSDPLTTSSFVLLLTLPALLLWAVTTMTRRVGSGSSR